MPEFIPKGYERLADAIDRAAKRFETESNPPTAADDWLRHEFEAESIEPTFPR